MGSIVKCKVNHLSYIANKEYPYEPCAHGIFSMLQVFAGTGDEDDDELFYPKEMEKYFFWEEEKDMTKVKKDTKVPPLPPPIKNVPPIVVKEEVSNNPHKKKYDLIMEQIKSRQKQIDLYPNDPNIDLWNIEIKNFTETAERIKKKIDV